MYPSFDSVTFSQRGLPQCGISDLCKTPILKVRSTSSNANDYIPLYFRSYGLVV